MKTPLLLLCLALVCRVHAQLPYNQTFKNGLPAGFVVSGAARMTSGTDDPAGNGYLRLTENTNYSTGYVYAQDSFPSNYGITASFEFYGWKSNATSNTVADGICFFLFDASVNSFRPGGTGGSLGYAQYNGLPGLAKGYIGIGIDEYGNFSNPSETRVGGPGQTRGAIVVRGPGNGKATTDYVYQTGVATSAAPYNASFIGFTQRYSDSANANYRRVKITLVPGSSAGANTGYKITVVLYKGGTVPCTPVTLISNLDYPYAAPGKLQFGIAASTGSVTNIHEIRNMTIDVANTAALLPPTLQPDAGVVACQGQKALLDVLSNDAVTNTGGAFNKLTVDLDPTAPGIQWNYSDATGAYTTDSTGTVTFVPAAGYSGTSTAQYVVTDNYGATATTPGLITVTVSAATGPTLVLNAPAKVCAPATVDITQPALIASGTSGAAYTYYSTLNDANAGTNAIAGTAISVDGTYYVRSSLSGCNTVKPIVVSISQKPTTAVAGSNLNFCSNTTNASATLGANNPDVGVGAWSVISHPGTVPTITFPDASTSPVSNLAKGVTVLRWTISSGACAASTSDLTVSVGMPAVAGPAQTFVNATSTTLAATAAAPAVGSWTRTAGPALTITSPNSATSTVTGLVPGNTYTLQWKTVNGNCTNYSSVVLTDVLNTIADAGADKSALPGTLTLGGNTPGTGNTGTWSVLSQPVGAAVTIDQPTVPNSTVSNVSQTGNYTFRWTMTNSGFSNYDDMTWKVVNVLPVHFISFTARRMEGDVLLEWRTGTETDNDHFVVERSADGRRFEAIARVAGAGTTTQEHAYAYTDRITADAPLYYRIRQVDASGASALSAIARLGAAAGAQSLVLAPNPVRDLLRVSCASESGGPALLRLRTADGRLLRLQPVTLRPGANAFTIDDLGQLPAGVLVVELCDAGGCRSGVVVKGE